MPVTLLMNPDTLAWDDFEQVDEVKDPRTGESLSAFTGFEWDWPTKNLRKDGDKVALPDVVLMITPDCKVRKDSVALKDKAKGDALLSHEQFHYDVAHVCARVLVHRLNQLRAKNEAALNAEVDLLFNLHLRVRPLLIHRHYDRSTNHGKEPNAQKRWKQMMATALADKNALMLAGYWL